MNGNIKKNTFFKISGILGLILLLVVFAALDNYSKKPAEKKGHDHSDPAQHGANVNAEKLENKDSLHSPSGKLEDGKRIVNYEAFQYAFSPDPLVVKAGEDVVLNVKSRDVKHGMMIPEIDFNTEISPDKTKTVSFKAPETPGKYPIFCSVYCGAGHGNMKGTLLVLPGQENPDHDH